MTNHFFARASLAGLLGGVVISLGCDKSPAGPASPAALPVPLAVTAISPAGGLVGDQVKVGGAGFLSGATLTLDGVAAKVTGVTSATITAITPVHAAGTVDVVVTNLGGERATLTAGYTYGHVSLTVSPNGVVSGAQLEVSWVAPSGRSPLDWIALVNLGDANEDYEHGWWQYTRGATSGTLTLSAPTQPGEYEFRYLLDDGYLEAGRSSRVTVSVSPSP
jgi:hypothetical protein